MNIGSKDGYQNQFPKPEPDKHGRFVLDFGQFKGTPITRVPVHYLKWILNSGHTYGHLAQAELARRGTVTPTLEVSGHAIDRASQRLLGSWCRDKVGDEGLHAWLVRKSSEALKTPLAKDGSVRHQGIKFVFEQMYGWPVLKTVVPDKGS